MNVSKMNGKSLTKAFNTVLMKKYGTENENPKGKLKNLISLKTLAPSFAQLFCWNKNRLCFSFSY